jgi:ribonuclease BN (tRNA processing enzyme)
MNRCRITFLGSSSGMPSPTRFCTSLLFQTDESSFLLDCGEGASFSLLQNKIDPLLIDAIFVSHAHVDLLKRKTPLDVYLPEEAVSGVKDFLNTCYLFPGKINFRLSILPISTGFRLQQSGMSIQAHLNNHLAANKQMLEELDLPNKMQSFCFSLNLYGKRIVYSGDVQSTRDLEEITEDADVLITECVHPSLPELLSAIAEKGVKRAILTHVPPELESKQQEIIESARKIGLDKFDFAYDGLIVNA